MKRFVKFKANIKIKCRVCIVVAAGVTIMAKPVDSFTPIYENVVDLCLVANFLIGVDLIRSLFKLILSLTRLIGVGNWWCFVISDTCSLRDTS